MATIQVTTTHEIPEQVLSDIIVTAVEGGTGYWAEVSYYRPEPDGNPERTEATLHVIDDEDRGPLELNTWTIRRGLTRLSEDQPARFARLVDEDNDWDHDAEDADVIVQLALLGNITYG